MNFGFHGRVDAGRRTVQHNELVDREDRVLASAAVAALLTSATLAPDEYLSRTMQALLLVVPASLAATAALGRGERTIFAPPAALVIAVAVSGLLAAIRDTPWTFNGVVAILVVGHWLPWPRWRTERAAITVLWALAMAPLTVLLVAQTLGWSDPISDLISGSRITSSPGATNLNAMSLLWATLAAGVLAEQIGQRARVGRAIQGLAAVLLGATGSRTMAIAAVVTFATLLWRDRRRGLRAIVGRHWPWGLYGLALLPRISGRGYDAETGVYLSGRDWVWQTYLEDGRGLFLTGGGIGRPQAIAANHPRLQGLSTHNEYLWLAISVGVVGVILVAAAWFIAFRTRAPWALPRHPELLAPAAALPVLGLVEDPLLAISFVQPYLILLAAAATFSRGSVEPEPSRPG